MPTNMGRPSMNQDALCYSLNERATHSIENMINNRKKEKFMHEIM
jgi:hypothetical protein